MRITITLDIENIRIIGNMEKQTVGEVMDLLLFIANVGIG